MPQIDVIANTMEKALQEKARKASAEEKAHANEAPTTIESGSTVGPGDKVPDHWIIIGGKAFDPFTDCNPWKEGDAVGVKCGGDTGLALAVGTALTLGTIWLVDKLTKNPRTVYLEQFPDVSGEDNIDLALSPAIDPTDFTLTLDTSHEMWLKTAEFYIGDNTSKGVISTQKTRRIQTLTIPVEFCGYWKARIILGKAKAFGILTQMYGIPLTKDLGGQDMHLTWRKD